MVATATAWHRPGLSTGSSKRPSRRAARTAAASSSSSPWPSSSRSPGGDASGDDALFGSDRPLQELHKPGAGLAIASRPPLPLGSLLGGRPSGQSWLLAPLRPRAEFVKSSRLLARLGINVSPGALCQAAQSTSTDLVPVQDSIVKAVNDSPMIVPDESGGEWGGEGACCGRPRRQRRRPTGSPTGAAMTRPAR